MRSARRFRHLARHALLVLMTGAALVVSVAAAAAQNAGSVQELAGHAFAGTSASRRTLEPRAAILLGDQVETGDQSRVTMLLGRQTTVRLGERGRVTIDRFLVDAGGDITLQSGPVMVEHPDELAFGVSVEPQKWVPSVDAWIERWKADRYALALIPPPTYARLLKQGLPMQVIARDSRRVVVMKPLAASGTPAPMEKPQQ